MAVGVAADWGSVPAWIALIGGFIAAAAFWTGRRDRTKADAARVYAVVTSFRGGGRSDENFTNTRIYNDGARPIFDVGLSVWEWGRRRWTWRVRRHEHCMTGNRIEGAVYSGVLPGTNTTEAELRGLVTYSRYGLEVAPPILLIFRDGNGRRWIRWPDGRLSRLRPSRPIVKLLRDIHRRLNAELAADVQDEPL
jgi:hypothetical protein